MMTVCSQSEVTLPLKLENNIHEMKSMSSVLWKIVLSKIDLSKTVLSKTVLSKTVLSKTVYNELHLRQWLFAFNSMMHSWSSNQLFIKWKSFGVSRIILQRSMLLFFAIYTHNINDFIDCSIQMHNLLAIHGYSKEPNDKLVILK